jgi:hypothetical protein
MSARETLVRVEPLVVEKLEGDGCEVEDARVNGGCSVIVVVGLLLSSPAGGVDGMP